MTPQRLTPEHAEAYRALMLEGYAQHPDAFTASVAERGPLPLGWWLQRVEAGPGANERVFGVWSPEGALAGVAGLSFETRPKTRHKASLFGMYVPARHRGRGWGRALVQAVLDDARARPGTLLVQLTVTEGNEAAERLYARCGFVRFGIEPLAMAHGTGHVAKVHMWCDLRPTT